MLRDRCAVFTASPKHRDKGKQSRHQRPAQQRDESIDPANHFRKLYSVLDRGKWAAGAAPSHALFKIIAEKPKLFANVPRTIMQMSFSAAFNITEPLAGSQRRASNRPRRLVSNRRMTSTGAFAEHVTRSFAGRGLPSECVGDWTCAA
jgi:hypothetical protein